MASRGKDTEGGRQIKPLRLLALGLLVAAVVKELRTPAEERTWNGTLGGLVPYDLRPPTVDRMRARWWSPDDERIFTPQPFGVGWTVNAGRVVALVRQGAESR